MKTEQQQRSAETIPTTINPNRSAHIPAARERATRLAESADALIDRILSGDSRAFLEANRQTGGE